MANIQGFFCAHGYVVSEMIREIHQYHLDDRPSLKSCNVVVDRVSNKPPPYAGRRFGDSEMTNFYGRRDIRMPSHIDRQGDFVMDDGTKVSADDRPKWRAQPEPPATGA